MGAPVPYMDKLRTLAPFALFPMNEITGSNALCLINPLNNAPYINTPTLANAATPWGDTCPYFDGVNQKVNLSAVAAIVSAFNFAEGAVSIWAKVNAAAVWEDATARTIWNGYLQAGNLAYIQKTTTNDQIRYQRTAGGGAESQLYTTSAPTDWFNVTLSWSHTGDIVAYYYNSTQLGTDTGLVAAVGTAADMSISSAASSWHGWLAGAALFDRYVTPGEASYIYYEGLK